MNEILRYLKMHGERLNKEIAVATGTSLVFVRLQLAELTAKHEVVVCHSIRFNTVTNDTKAIFNLLNSSQYSSRLARQSAMPS